VCHADLPQEFRAITAHLPQEVRSGVESRV